MGLIRADVEGRGLQVIGQTTDRGIFPEQIAPTWAPWGSDSMPFTIARDPALAHADLQAFTPLEYLPAGAGDEPAWSGYIVDAPAAGDGLISVNAKGWHYALDDDPYTDAFVSEDLGTWADLRAAPSSFLYGQGGGLPGWAAGGTVQAGAGEITLAYPTGMVVKVQSAIGVFLDLGPLSRGAKTVSVDYFLPAGFGGIAGTALYVRGSTDPSSQFFATGADDGGGPFGFAVGAQTATAVFGSTKRYVAIFFYSSAGGTATAENIVQIRGIRVFTDDTYRSGAASALLASQVVARALTYVPALDQSTALIQATSFPIRSYGGIDTERSARQDMENVNTYHRWLLRVNARRRVEFRPRLAVPTLEVNTHRPGVNWQDATRDSGEDVYNKVTVRGASGSGARLAVTRTSSQIGIRNVLDRRGRTRSKVLDVQAPTDPSTMQQLADVWLGRYARTPLKGTLTITGPDALREYGGQRPVPAAFAGPRTGELISLADLIDPDTGGIGRAAITVGGSYNEDADTCAMAIDNTRDDIEAVLARMGVVSDG